MEKDEAAHRFVVDAKGKDKRGNGTAGAKVTVSMTDAGGSTDVSVETDLAITGKPAQFGRGVMQDVSDKLLGQFVTCLEQRLAAPEEPSGGEPAAASPAPEAADPPPAAAARLRRPPPPPPAAPPPPPPPPQPRGARPRQRGAAGAAKSYWKQALGARRRPGRPPAGAAARR